MDKKAFRTDMINKLKSFSKQEHAQFSYEIANQLFMDEWWKQSKTIGITVSNPPEVDTYHIIRKAWELNKRVVVPKCHPKEKQMTFHEIQKFTQLESVYYGLLEPIEEETTKVEADDIELLVVPGLAYNKDGFRLGFGGGYYDRFLSNYQGKTVSLTFAIQINEEIPIEAHDIPVGKLITYPKV